MNNAADLFLEAQEALEKVWFVQTMKFLARVEDLLSEHFLL